MGILDVPKMIRETPVELLNYWIAHIAMSKQKYNKLDYQLGTITKIVAEKDTKTNRPLEKYMISFKTLDEKVEEEVDRSFKFLSGLPGAIIEN